MLPSLLDLQFPIYLCYLFKRERNVQQLFRQEKVVKLSQQAYTMGHCLDYCNGQVSRQKKKGGKHYMTVTLVKTLLITHIEVLMNGRAL